MPKRQVFFSFKYLDDFDRVNQIRNMGVIEGDSIVSDNEWEEVKQTPEKIKKWIEDQMDNRSCVIVCIGENTHDSYYCLYEIERAWKLGKGLLGIHIHNINDLDAKKCSKGINPFSKFSIKIDEKNVLLSDIVQVYDPVVAKNKNNDNCSSYGDIKDNLADLIEDAIKLREQYSEAIDISKSGNLSNQARVSQVSNPPKQWLSKE